MSGQLRAVVCLSLRAEPPVSIEVRASLAPESMWSLRIREKAVPLPEIEPRFDGSADCFSFSVLMTHIQEKNKYCIRDGG